MNLPDLFWSYLGQGPGTPASARAMMDAARAQGFTHARFAATPYWPIDMTGSKGWKNFPGVYWAAFDQLVADARARGLRLVPSMFWNLYMFPDAFGEPIGKLFTPASVTRVKAEQYVTEFVTRYANEPAIAAWELGNEYNLLADLDVSSCNVCGTNTNACGALAPSLGTPCQRSAADNLFSCNTCRSVTSTQQDLGQFTSAIAQKVKSLDPLQRPFSSGNGYPRAAAWHLGKSPCPACDWTLDSPTEYSSALTQLHGAGVDWVSVHHYPGAENKRFGDDDPDGIALLQRTQALVTGAGKLLYVGEYGEPNGGSTTCGAYTEVCGGNASKPTTRRVLNALVKENVGASALWAFEFHQFCAAVPTCYTIEAGDDVVTHLKNAQLSSGACAGLADGTACPLGACSLGVCATVPKGSFGFDSSGDEAAWLAWTNCSSCTPGTQTRVAAPSGGALHLQSYDLPCAGSCMYPGLYSLSPAVAVSPGHALIVYSASSSAADSVVRVIVQDSLANELAQATGIVTQAGSLERRAIWLALPPLAARVQLRLEVPSPNAIATFDSISVDWQP